MIEPMQQTGQTPPQETPLFVATCVYTKETWQAVYRIQLRPACWALIGLALLEGVFAFGSAVDGGFVVTETFALSGIWLGVMTSLIAWFPHRYATRQCAVAQTLYGRERTTRVWFYADRLLQVEYPTGGQVTLRYDLIRRVELTPTLVILRLPNGVYLPVERSQFEYGDGRLFVPFLQQQNPHLVVRGR